MRGGGEGESEVGVAGCDGGGAEVQGRGSGGLVEVSGKSYEVVREGGGVKMFE